MTKTNVLAAITLFIIVACSSPKEKSLERINALEAKDSVFTPQNVEELKKAYLEFAEKYPDDEMAPEFTFKAAQRCNVMAQHQEALKLFQQIREKYPKNRLSEEALFLQGYIYENSLQDFPNAKRIYTEFIEQYPNSELAQDAKLAIKNLGKSPEEIFSEFSAGDSLSQ